MPAEQSLKSHVRIDPAHHPAILILAINVLVAIAWAFIAHTPGLPLRMWVVLVSITLFISSMKARLNPLKVQDRVIRLEERLRYAAVLSPSQLAVAETLPTRSLIALRFASDAQLPTLVERAAAEHLSPAQIKQAISPWRPDTHRV